MATKKTVSKTKPDSPVQQRLWLMYPPKLIKKPFIWEVGHKFKVVTNIRQASVTDEIGISKRYFIDIFRNEVGLTPKLFCRVRRFQQALRQITSGTRIDWLNVALESGYFDQAHFIHDFRAFSNINPSAYLSDYQGHVNHVPVNHAAPNR